MLLCELLRALPSTLLQANAVEPRQSVLTALNQPSHQVRALSGDGYFSEVDLEDVQLDDNGMIALTAALQRNSTLRNLNLACNSINEVSKYTGILWARNITHRPPPVTGFVSPVPPPPTGERGAHWREGRSRFAFAA